MADPLSIAEHTVQDLRQRSSLWYKVHVFVYDLRNFQEKVDSQARLDSIVDASYLGLPYFRADEVDNLKSTLVDGTALHQIIQSVLDERLERRIKKRVDSGDYRVCAAHDLAPIFEKAFSIKPKELATNSRFQELLATHGLNLKEGEEFSGLAKVHTFSNQGQKNKKGKKGGRK